MRSKLATLAVAVLIAAPALAGNAGNATPSPDPEAGIGIVALSLLGAGMVWLKRRRLRR